jgi:hypothetical protein
MINGSRILEEIVLGGSSQDVIPGIGSLTELEIRDIWKTRCAVCARVCFVLEGLHIYFAGESKERNLAFIHQYMLQKPLKCSYCNSYLCAKCAERAATQAPISGIVMTPLGQAFRTACPFCRWSRVEFA